VIEGIEVLGCEFSDKDFLMELADGRILQLYLLTFKVALLGIVFSGNPGCLDYFSSELEVRLMKF
jgi:hypothetical protein